MRARDFDSVLEVFRMTQKKGEYGEITARFTSSGTIKADRVKNEGRHMVVLGEQYPLYTAEYHIRDGNRLKEGWRVRDLDSDVLYEIIAIIHDRQKRMLTIKCTGVNPNGDTDRHEQGDQRDLP